MKPVIIILVIVVVLVLLGNLPLPHGGTLGGELYTHFKGELGNEVEEFKQAAIDREQESIQRRQFYEDMAKRFSGPIPYEVSGEPTNGWQLVIAGGQPAALDLEIGMIYGAKVGPDLPDWSANSLAQAQTRCRELTPQGYWALPTGEEMDLAHEHGILENIPGSRGRWIVHVISFDGHDGPGLKAWGGTGGVDVRCVARSSDSPAAGYMRGDPDR